MSNNLSFCFSKKNEKKNLKHSVLNENEPVVQDSIKYVTHIDKNEQQDIKKEEIVIPLIKKNRWYLKPDDIENDIVISKDEVANKNINKNPIKSGDKLVDAAIEEILKDAANFNESKTETFLDLKIPILLQNKVPGNYETDDRLDVKLRPESNIEDYNDVPIESFGMAMLRGMGWNENAKSVKIKEVKVRPKGLGLAADKSVSKQLDNATDKDPAKKEEKLHFKKGTNCLVVDGRFRGKYATIMGIDEDNSRVVLSLSLNEEMVTVSRFAVQLITKKEYERGYRCLNQAKVDEYKKQKEPASEAPLPILTDVSTKEDKHPSRETNLNGHSKKIRLDDNLAHMSPQDEIGLPTSWLHTSLRVRFIDKLFKSGRFYKSKLIIEDLISRNVCICKTDDGKILDDIHSKQLETIVPKEVPSFVMVLSGKYKFKLAELLDRNSKDSVGHVQLLSDRDVVLKLSFDDICEYVGHVDSHHDY